MIERRPLEKNNGVTSKTMGGPTYKPEYAAQARTVTARLGATDADLAQLFGVNVSMISRWACEYDDFSRALKIGRSEFDDRVERSLAQRAVGYDYWLEKVFYDRKTGTVVRAPTLVHMPPDPAAAFIWLKNRIPERWRDKPKPLTLDLSQFSDEELAAAEIFCRARDRVLENQV
jgi:hypothetical protein